MLCGLVITTGLNATFLYSACDNDDEIRYVDSPFDLDRPGIGAIFLYLTFQGIIFFLLTLLIEVSHQH